MWKALLHRIQHTLLLSVCMLLSGCASIEKAKVPEEISNLDGKALVYQTAVEVRNSISPVVTPLLAIAIGYCAITFMVNNDEQKKREAKGWLWTAVAYASLFYILPQLFQWIIGALG